MKIVTSGSPYLDIDGYASCIAYAELLRASGFEARAVSTSIPNNSITPAAKSWTVQFDETYSANPDDSFIILDTSSPDNLDKVVNLEKVEAVIDHHPGFEKYWHRQLGSRAVIEPVGSACTLVYEIWQREKLTSMLSREAAKLMTYGILDNTLNFQASITDIRDEKAYRALSRIASLPAHWAETYFTDCDRGLEANFAEALLNDIKILRLRSLGKSLAVGQVAIWGKSDLLNHRHEQVRQIMSEAGEHWFVNFIGIGEGRNRLLASDATVADWLANLLGASSTDVDGTILTDRLWLRKEILGRDIAIASDR